MPAVAAAASWLENYKVPLREVKRLYTRSELFISAWRSQEMSWNMKQSTKKNERLLPEQTAAEDALEQRLGDLVQKGVNEDGEVDLRNLTGPEMQKWLGAFGINLAPGIERRVEG
jgi:hypothetical protein